MRWGKQHKPAVRCGSYSPSSSQEEQEVLQAKFQDWTWSGSRQRSPPPRDAPDLYAQARRVLGPGESPSSNSKPRSAVVLKARWHERRSRTPRRQVRERAGTRADRGAAGGPVSPEKAKAETAVRESLRKAAAEATVREVLQEKLATIKVERGLVPEKAPVVKVKEEPPVAPKAAAKKTAKELGEAAATDQSFAKPVPSAEDKAAAKAPSVSEEARPVPMERAPPVAPPCKPESPVKEAAPPAMASALEPPERRKRARGREAPLAQPVKAPEQAPPPPPPPPLTSSMAPLQDRSRRPLTGGGLGESAKMAVVEISYHDKVKLVRHQATTTVSELLALYEKRLQGAAAGAKRLKVCDQAGVELGAEVTLKLLKRDSSTGTVRLTFAEDDWFD